ncbi:Sieve element occlusion [Parasponia andersonii]|uniref:Sieve element occlusion n=1 Tax=Parasponia andersonii TaxID=3476 RepID=A0A2P5AWH2_PARAD|nr:Sieve element occlusion [Parasponia andersonii]
MESPNVYDQKTELDLPQGDGNEELIKQILDTSTVDFNSQNCNIPYLKPLLNIVHIILKDADDQPRGSIKDSSALDLAEIQVPECVYEKIPTSVIQAISHEIFSMCLDGVDVHSKTMKILQLLKLYNWDAKVALALVAFAVTFGEFRLLASRYTTNSVANAVALLKQMPRALNPELVDGLCTLVREILDVTDKIVEFYDFPSHICFTTESPEILATRSHIPKAVYWTIRSIVVSSTQILSLMTAGDEEDEEIMFLIMDQSESAEKLKSENDHLVELIKCRNGSLEIHKSKDEYQDKVRILGSSNADNSKSLKIFLNKPGLYDCYKKKKISYDQHLKSKVVALFITNLDNDLASGAEYAILQQMYLEKWHNLIRSDSNYEVVWIPIVDINTWTREKLKLFKRLRDQMEWHSVDNPSNVDIRFIKKECNFVEKPLVVVMDAQGNIVHKNGIYMMCTWGSLAYPFTATREKELWKEMQWKIDLLTDNIELNMDNWIQKGKHICLYGGEDENWIKRFTKNAKAVANEVDINLELLYVGRSKLKKKLVEITDIIQRENLSRTLDWNLIWYFWVRLESMLYSKHLTTECSKNDLIMQGINTLISYDSEHENWAIISSGRGDQMITANGEDVLKGLRKLLKRKQRENKIDFVRALRESICQTRPAASNDDMSHILASTVSKKNYETFMVVEAILESTNIDDSNSRSVLFHHKYGNRAFCEFYNKKKISNNNLRRKSVALFITDLDPELLCGLEYVTLHEIYLEMWHNSTSTESQCDIVWVPILEFGLNEQYMIFESLRDHMKWQSVNPVMVAPAVIEYIKEKWNFSNKPMLVVMDTQYNIVHHNAIHMTCIWRSRAYPVSTDKEKLLWEEMNWSIQFLVDNLEPNMGTWVEDGRYICLYGGEDIEWIRKFTRLAKDASRKALINFEFLYVGGINLKESVVKSNIEIIQRENLSRTLEWKHICYFWIRLESMWHSKQRLTKFKNVLKDPVIQGIVEMRSYGYMEEGWTVISRGLDKTMVKGIGKNMLQVLENYLWWKARKVNIGFLSSLTEYLREEMHHYSHSDDLVFPATAPTFESNSPSSVTTQIGNSRYLSELFHYRDDKPALYDCFNKKTIDVEELRWKVIVLFITSLDFELPYGPEYAILEKLYLKKGHNQATAERLYHVIWVPVLDIGSDNEQKSFNILRDHMKWHSVDHPSVVSPMAIMNFKERWNFVSKPLVVVMDAQGSIGHTNAIHMMNIWGRRAYPFAYIGERLLWEEMNWSIELVVKNFVPNFHIWLREGRHICLYGGEDIEWIRKFTRIAKDVAREAGITLELLYLGRYKIQERVFTSYIIEIIHRERLSRTLDWKLIWFFWLRLESMLLSRGQLINDPIVHGIDEILRYGSGRQGWAVIGKGIGDMVKNNGERMFKVLAEHDRWKSREYEIGFVSALNEYLHQM